eukprot:GEMP01027987.1.p1 GENE.GEMP01027987.1~~GEMP01027987.1.p1  ORF type:complete len:384 (+),score=78.72 GEMP01027987.1:123-1274(+)
MGILSKLEEDSGKLTKDSVALKEAQESIDSLVPRLSLHETEIKKRIASLKDATPGDPFSFVGDFFFSNNDKRRLEAITDFQSATDNLDELRSKLGNIKEMLTNLLQIVRNCMRYLKIVKEHLSALQAILICNFQSTGLEKYSLELFKSFRTIITTLFTGEFMRDIREAGIDRAAAGFMLDILEGGNQKLDDAAFVVIVALAAVAVIGGAVAGMTRKDKFEASKKDAKGVRQETSKLLNEVENKRVDLNELFSNIRDKLTAANFDCKPDPGEIADAFDKMVESLSQLASATPVYRSLMEDGTPKDKALSHAVKAFRSLHWSEKEKKQLILVDDAISDTKADIDVQKAIRSAGIKLTDRVVTIVKLNAADLIEDDASTAAGSDSN